MVRAAYIEDDVSRLVLVGDRAHGVSSQAHGRLEVKKNKTTAANIRLRRASQTQVDAL